MNSALWVKHTSWNSMTFLISNINISFAIFTASSMRYENFLVNFHMKSASFWQIKIVLAIHATRTENALSCIMCFSILSLKYYRCCAIATSKCRVIFLYRVKSKERWRCQKTHTHNCYKKYIFVISTFWHFICTQKLWVWAQFRLTVRARSEHRFHARKPELFF